MFVMCIHVSLRINVHTLNLINIQALPKNCKPSYTPLFHCQMYSSNHVTIYLEQNKYHECITEDKYMIRLKSAHID